MSAIVLQVLVAIIGLAKWYYAQQQTEAARYAELQKGRSDIVNGNVGAVESRIDRLLVGSNPSTVGHLPSAESLERRIGSL
jgi:hypothetical protein